MDKVLPNTLTKVIFLLLAVAVVLEIIWAGWSLLNPPSFAPTAIVSTAAPHRQTSISLTSPNHQIKLGNKFNVSINLFSEKNTDGADLIISFDPKLLSVDSPTPVKLGKIYDDYPVNKLDSSLGKITVSGITSRKGGVKPNGLFGEITFQTKSAGLAKIALDFTLGSTVDTNVIETSSGKDILEKVDNLEVKIQ